ncbi:MAG: hypothetical protein ABTQ25_18430 [Nitrosomonas ureae]
MTNDKCWASFVSPTYNWSSVGCADRKEAHHQKRVKTGKQAQWQNTGVCMFPEVPGFFTVNLAERKNNRLLVEKIDLLRSE